MTDATQPEQKRSGCAGWLLSLLALALIRSAVKELGWPEWWTLVGWAALVLIVAVVIAARRQASEQRPQQPKEPPGRPAPLSMGGEPEQERRRVLGTLAADLDALLGDRLEQGSEEALLVGGGVQVDGVVPAQEVVQVEVVAVGGGGHALVAVDGQDLLGGGIQAVHGPVGAILRGLPGVHGRWHPGRLQDVFDLLVLA